MTFYSGREFVEGALIQEVNGTVLSTNDKGLLSVIFVDRHSKEEIHGTVCADNFNWATANSFCHYFGYEQGEWGSESVDRSKFVSG